MSPLEAALESRREHQKHVDAHNEYRQACRNNPTPPKEAPIMTDFNAHTVYLTNKQEKAARNGSMSKVEALDVITESFLPEINLVKGDIVFFADNGRNKYEIVRTKGESVITRRLVANSDGPAGETNVATISWIVSAVRDGRAVINPEVSA